MLLNTQNHTSVRVPALVDSGCTKDLINPMLASGLGVEITRLPSPIIFEQMDGSPMKGDPCTEMTAPLLMGLGLHWERRSFVIAPTAKYPVVLGVDWLEDHDPLIHWSKKMLIFQDPPCSAHRWNDEWGPCPQVRFETAGLTCEELKSIPAPYRDLFHVFEEEEADEFPRHRSTDCALDILPGGKLPKTKLYPMSQDEKQELRRYIDKNLARGFIHPVTASHAAPVMFVKKDGGLRLCID